MRALKICLWIVGIFFLTGLVGLFLPDAVWVSIVQFFGVEAAAFTDFPLAEYMLRACLAMSAIIGVYLIVMALDPAKYKVLIPLTGLALMSLGLVCLLSGLLSAMPAKWFIADSFSCMLPGTMIIVFWQTAKLTGTK